MYKILYRFINARYSLPTWLWTFASLSVGFIVFTYSVTKNPAVAAFSNALPFGGTIWGSGLTIAGLATMLGMATHRKWFVRLGSMTSFCFWVFGAIAFGQHGAANVVIFAGPLLAFWAYIYLSTHVREYPRL